MSARSSPRSPSRSRPACDPARPLTRRRSPAGRSPAPADVRDYVDAPDRTNCLVRRYARFGDSPIVDRFVYENPHPDWVVLVEETIIKAVNFLRGTPDRGGVVVVNSVRDPHYLLKFLPDEMKAKIAKFVVVDAVGLADQSGRSPWMFVRNLS